MTDCTYDAILIVSFGGPEGPEDVIPFLQNVLRGRNVPEARMLEVAEHYQKFGGVSPINQQCRDLKSALESELQAAGVDLPVYWGNRNWHPLLPDILREMADAGHQRVLAFVTSAFSSYSGCRQYRENLASALTTLESECLTIDKIRVFYNHPDFVAVNAENVAQAIGQLQTQCGLSAADEIHVAFTAHSIPGSMAQSSDYEKQLQESCRLVAETTDIADERWQLVYQSRSGRPQDPWLEPDICDHLESLAEDGVQHVVISPIGFLSDHIEVLYDLDDEAQVACDRLGINMVRAATPGVHPRFVAMVRKLIEERLGRCTAEAIGRCGPSHDICPADCCPAPVQRGGPPASRPA